MKNDSDREASDQELLHAVSRGSEEAFVMLYRRHQGAVYRFALHMSGSRETAEEVVQEVFLGLLGRSSQYDAARGSLEAYLIGSARNQVRGRLRQAAALQIAIPLDVPGPDLEREQDLAKLREAILSLPPNYREVLVLCDMEEMSYEAAAERLRCPVGTVRSRLHRARALLLAKVRRSPVEVCRK
ncbi:MAG TPA: sigma-70 family RNA polymerase sigma factor [Bryobacteraceae bacterium]|nr:sigma-70 family RNA polymerase sigma factor [Bryobacteraceae bacterium]